jgi:hypothetical protein
MSWGSERLETLVLRYVFQICWIKTVMCFHPTLFPTKVL